MALNFSQMKKAHDISVRLKLILMAVSMLTGFVVFLILHYTKANVSALGVGLTIFFMMFGLSYAIIGAIIKDGWSYTAGSVALVAGLIVLLAIVIQITWYVWLISAFVLAALLAILMLIAVAPKLRFYAKNDSSDYKNYLERRAEKQLEPQPEEETLPELKSFKKED